MLEKLKAQLMYNPYPEMLQEALSRVDMWTNRCEFHRYVPEGPPMQMASHTLYTKISTFLAISGETDEDILRACHDMQKLLKEQLEAGGINPDKLAQ